MMVGSVPSLACALQPTGTDRPVHSARWAGRHDHLRDLYYLSRISGQGQAALPPQRRRCILARAIVIVLFAFGDCGSAGHEVLMWREVGRAGFLVNSFANTSPPTFPMYVWVRGTWGGVALPLRCVFTGWNLYRTVREGTVRRDAPRSAAADKEAQRHAIRGRDASRAERGPLLTLSFLVVTGEGSWDDRAPLPTQNPNRGCVRWDAGLLRRRNGPGGNLRPWRACYNCHARLSARMRDEGGTLRPLALRPKAVRLPFQWAQSDGPACPVRWPLSDSWHVGPPTESAIGCCRRSVIAGLMPSCLTTCCAPGPSYRPDARPIHRRGPIPRRDAGDGGARIHHPAGDRLAAIRRGSALPRARSAIIDGRPTVRKMDALLLLQMLGTLGSISTTFTYDESR